MTERPLTIEKEMAPLVLPENPCIGEPDKAIYNATESTYDGMDSV